ncbi:hypothetical protein AB0O42_23595 [Streptomyces sp. NPDC089922]|uniref:effector-associated constant component EACC1 n=1 Tax=unclassified Streptomyces TaxID=2593676 RepID=UPI0033FE218A
MTEYALRVDAPGGGGDAEDELRSLLRWLNADESLGRGLRGTLAADPERPAAGTPTSGTPSAGTLMGTGLDLVQLVVGSGLSTGSLVFSVLQWQASRRPAPSLTVSRGGYEVRLTGEAADDPEALRRIVALLEPSPEGGDDDGTA